MLFPASGPGRVMGDRGAVDPVVHRDCRAMAPRWPNCGRFTAIVYVLTSGCAWRDLPGSFGVNCKTEHLTFVQWTRKHSSVGWSGWSVLGGDGWHPQIAGHGGAQGGVGVESVFGGGGWWTGRSARRASSRRRVADWCQSEILIWVFTGRRSRSP